MPLYEYRCTACGTVSEELRPSERRFDQGLCPVCLSHSKAIYSVPVTDCLSIGRDQFYCRTPATHRKPHDARSAELIRDYQRRDGTHRQFGPGPKTTGT